MPQTKQDGENSDSLEGYRRQGSTTPDGARSLMDLEKAGSRHIQTAFRAETHQQFIDGLSEAIRFYEQQASRFSTSQNYSEDHGELFAKCSYLKARALLLRSWIVESPESTRNLALHSINLAEKALEEFLSEDPRLAENLANCYSHLVSCLAELIASEVKGESLRAIISKATDYCEKGIESFALVGDDEELIKITCLGYEFNLFQSEISSSAEIRENSKKKAEDYKRKCGELALILENGSLLIAEIGDPFLLAGRDALEKVCKKLLPAALDTRNNLLVCCLLKGLIDASSWGMDLQEEDPQIRTKMFEELQFNFSELRRRYDVVGPIGLHKLYLPIPYLDSFGPYVSMAELESSLESKKKLVEKAIEIGTLALMLFKNNPNLMIIESGVIRALLFKARLEPLKDAKRSLLNQVLALAKERLDPLQQISPHHYWDYGLGFLQLASIQFELSNLEENTIKRVDQINEAIDASSRGLDLVREYKPETAYGIQSLVRIALALEAQGKMWSSLYDLGGHDQALLRKKIELLNQAADTYVRADLLSRVAEVYWEIGMTHSRLAESLTASEFYGKASTYFKNASTKIPVLKEYYEDYALYMAGWSQAERAKHSHNAEEDYLSSEKYYLKASEVLEQSKTWLPISPHFRACAQLEYAENLIVANGEEAETIRILQDAAHAFKKCRQDLEILSDTTGDLRQTEILRSLADTSALRESYCEATISLEEAQSHYKKGQVTQSVEHFRDASESLEKLTGAQRSDWERREVEATIFSCNAWRMICEAGSKGSPEIYEDASREFVKSGNGTGKALVSQIAKGNSNYCFGMASALRFNQSWQLEEYELAKSYFYEAFDAYARARLSTEAESVMATERVIDAYLYIGDPLKEITPEGRVKNYFAAEKILESATELFGRAGQIARKDEIASIVKKLRGGNDVVPSLAEILSSCIMVPPEIVKNLSIYSSGGEPVGLSQFQGANVKLAVRLPEKIPAGKEFELRLELINAGKQDAMLQKLEFLLPSGVKLGKEESGVLKEIFGALELQRKRLAPLQVETLVLLATAEDFGEFELSPSVRYFDESGKLLSTKISVQIAAKPEFRFENEKTSAFLDALVEAFIQDHIRDKMRSEVSGERTMFQLAKATSLPSSTLYKGRNVGTAKAFGELISSGLVERRTYKGKRGRGGEVTRFRIAYEKKYVGDYIDERIVNMKIGGEETRA